VGWVVGTTVAAGAWDTVRDTGITNTGGPLEASGYSVAVFTDVRQPERHISCSARIEGVKKRAPSPPASLDLVVNDDGNEWFLLAFEPKGRDGMQVSCTPRDKRPDNATYAFTVVQGWEDRAYLGNAISIAGTFAGIALAIWTFIARRRRLHQETDDASA
jgi:hypothetical protein